MKPLKYLILYDQKIISKILKKISSYHITKSSQTKIVEEMKSEMHNLVMKNKINGLDLINRLLNLKIILKKTDKICIVKDLEINNKLKELETIKFDECELLQENLKVETLKSRFGGRPNSIEEEIELRKQTRKKIL